MNDQLKAHGALVSAGLIFGANYIISKNLMPHYCSPYQIMFFRMIGATAIFFLLQKFYTPEKVEKKDLLKIAICSLFGIGLNQMLFFIGLNKTTAINAAIIHACSPVIVLLFSFLIIKEVISFHKILGIILGISGAFIMILYKKNMSFASTTMIGDLLIFVNIVSYSLYLVLVKPLMHKYKPLTVMKWIFVFGSMFVLPVTSYSMFQMNWAGMDSYAWVSILYIIIATTVIAYLLTIYSLQHVNATVVGFYIYLQPIFATIIALIIGTEILTTEKILSATLIFVGVYLVSKRNSKSEQMPERNQ